MASKPEKTKSSDISVMADGIVLKRVQTFGRNVDITREQAEELANSGIVEYIADSPNVTIQIDTNDVGAVDTLALLTDSLLDQGGSYSGASANAAGGTNIKYYIKAASANAATITQTDMLNGYCDITATFNEETETAASTMWMNHCALTAVNLSYDVNGNAAANYTLAADNATWFLGNWANARCSKLLLENISTAGGTSQHFTNLTSVIPDGSSVLAIGVNNVILRSTAGGGGVTSNMTASVVASGAFTASSDVLSTPWVSTAADSTDRVWVVFKPASNYTLWESSSAATDPGWELESTAGALGAIRRGQITAYLWNTQTPGKGTYSAAGQALRLQTVTIDVALGEDKLYELGTDGFYAISKKTPVPVTVSVTAEDSDLEYFAALTSQDYEQSNVTSLTISDFNGYNNLKIQIYKDKAKTTLLDTITVENMYVQANNFNVSVGNNATNEINFTADNISIVGSGTNVVGGWT